MQRRALLLAGASLALPSMAQSGHAVLKVAREAPKIGPIASVTMRLHVDHQPLLEALQVLKDAAQADAAMCDALGMLLLGQGGHLALAGFFRIADTLGLSEAGVIYCAFEPTPRGRQLLDAARAGDVAEVHRLTGVVGVFDA